MAPSLARIASVPLRRRITPPAGAPQATRAARHAQQMLERAEETARRLAGQLVARKVAECRAAPAAVSHSWHNRLNCRFRLDANASKHALTLLDRTTSTRPCSDARDGRFAVAKEASPGYRPALSRFVRGGRVLGGCSYYSSGGREQAVGRGRNQ